MMKKALVQDAVREIRNNFKRFLSILLIVLLGVGFFAGIKATSPDMKKTIDTYFDEKNVFDFEVLSTMGLNDSDIEELQKVNQVKNIVPSYSSDSICHVNDMDVVVKIKTILNEMNELELIDGEMPKNENECVVEKGFLTKTGYNIGDKISLQVEDIQDEERK